MNSHTAINVPEASDWTQGGKQVMFQQCGACHHTWYFHRSFCPACGHAAPATVTSTGLGTVHAITLVHRAPSDEFRAAAPYRIVLVDATSTASPIWATLKGLGKKCMLGMSISRRSCSSA